MKTIVYTQYGSPDVLHLQEAEKPTPKDNEVLIKVAATTVTSGDARLRSSITPTGFWVPIRLAFGIFKPRNPILGSEVSGTVEAVGKNVTRFKKGDQVFGMKVLGGYAEYRCVPEDGCLVTKPAQLTHEEAAAVPFGGLTALFFLGAAKLQKGKKVLINGASGAIGVYAVQLAKYFGAEVTAVCSSANIDLVKSLGADHVIDYTRTDFTQNGQVYDVILDTVGNCSFSRCKNSLTENGQVQLAVAGVPDFLVMLWVSLTQRKKVFAGVSTEKPEDLQFLKELLETGKLKAIVDRCYPLEQTAEAHRYVDTGRKKGAVVIRVGA